MKRKDLYNYIKEEIVNTLSEESVAWSSATKSKAKQQIDKSKLSGDAKREAKDEIDQNASGLISNVSESDLDEARKAGGYRVGDASKFAEAKELYSQGLYADILNAIEEAGDDGITQKELGAKLGKGDGTSLNSILNKFKAIGVTAGGRLDKVEKPEKPEKPEAEEPESTSSEVDDFFKVDDEFETPEEEPTAVGDKELEKVVGKSSFDLTPEEQKLFDTYKTAISNKVKTLTDKKASAADKAKAQAAIDNYKVKDDVKKVFAKKGLKLIDYINSELNK